MGLYLYIVGDQKRHQNLNDWQNDSALEILTVNINVQDKDNMLVLSPHQYGCQSRKYDQTLRSFLPFVSENPMEDTVVALLSVSKKGFLATLKQLWAKMVICVIARRRCNRSSSSIQVPRLQVKLTEYFFDFFHLGSLTSSSYAGPYHVKHPKIDQPSQVNMVNPIHTYS